jgi:hypothetical protein
MSGHSVALSWKAPGFGQIRQYSIWRAVGSAAQVATNPSAFTKIKTLMGAPPLTTFTDSTVKNNTTYTYFVTDANQQKVQSAPSATATIFVKY